MLKNLILSHFIILIFSCQKVESEKTYKWPLVEFPSGVKVKIEVSRTEEERTIGLMFRKSIPEDRGMLFVFDVEDYQSFWMKNCFFPLDIIFIDKNFKVVDIKENFQPCTEDPCPSYVSKEKAKYVLEVNGGFCKKNNIKTGIELKLPDIFNKNI